MRGVGQRCGYPGVDGVDCAVRPGTVLLRGQIFGAFRRWRGVCGVTGGKFDTDSDIANRRWRCRSLQVRGRALGDGGLVTE
jgi:hypothetical protein